MIVNQTYDFLTTNFDLVYCLTSYLAGRQG